MVWRGMVKMMHIAFGVGSMAGVRELGVYWRLRHDADIYMRIA